MIGRGRISLEYSDPRLDLASETMCGILFTNYERADRESFARSLELMRHRGPDARGVATHGQNMLGHVRLKIVDLDDRSNQPFYSRDGRHVIIFNGEIYNYKELAKTKKLEQRTAGDTEVLLELFVRYGAKCLSWLNGMFAFVILDTTTGQTFAARDRLGVKPLYIHHSRQHLTLSSEIAPILAMHPDVRFDEIGLRQYRKLRTFFNDRTLYSGIRMFPAGHFMENGVLHRYWALPEKSELPPTDEEVREMVCTSVKQRLLSDVPVGSYLSGGLDSTIVAGLSRKPHTWTVGFDRHNEFEWGRLAADHLESIHHEVHITPDEFVELARMMIVQRREPLSVPNEVLLYKMTREVKKINTVILSGEGADELFFGYDRIFRWASKTPVWDVGQFSNLYSYGSNHDPEIVEDAIAPYLHLGDPVRIVAHFFQIAHLHGLLRRLDSATMLCSVEARVPFVDYHPLIERMSGVSFSYRMNNGEVKAPLKRIFRDIVPSAILNRQKVGFPVPLDIMPFKSYSSDPPMDRWLKFNLQALGCEFESETDQQKGIV